MPYTRDEVVAISNRAAEAAGAPPLLVLAAGCAEGSLAWNARRPADPSQDAAAWTDVSMGPWQQTVRWSREYQDWCAANGHPPALFPGADVTEAIGSRYYDVEHAADVAARQLRGHYRADEDDAVFKALCRYNWPAGDGAPKGSAQATNYRRGIMEAERILASMQPNTGGNPDAGGIMPADPWTRTQLTNGSAVSTPSEWPTSDPRPIRSLVWHDMEGYLPGAIATWNQGAASAHLCVLRDGTIVRTVEIENIAWHAGTNATIGRTDFWRSHNINPYSIGVELEGFVTGGYTAEQVAACVRIGRWALERYGIPPVRGGDSLDGHHLHGEISNQRSDPGPLFPFDAILGAIKEVPAVPSATDPSQEPFAFVLGFADLAARLGRETVGDPLEHEHTTSRDGHTVNHQLTTRGEMVYFPEVNATRFYPAA